LAIVDVSDPGAPRVVSQIAGREPVDDISLRGQIGFVLRFSGVQMWDFSDPVDPVLFDTYAGPVWPVAAKKDVELAYPYLYLAAQDGGLKVYSLAGCLAP